MVALLAGDTDADDHTLSNSAASYPDSDGDTFINGAANADLVPSHPDGDCDAFADDTAANSDFNDHAHGLADLAASLININTNTDFNRHPHIFPPTYSDGDCNCDDIIHSIFSSIYADGYSHSHPTALM